MTNFALSLMLSAWVEQNRNSPRSLAHAMRSNFRQALEAIDAAGLRVVAKVDEQPCPLCEGFGVIHRHAARPLHEPGTPAFVWVPSRCVYSGGDRNCPVCTGSFDLIEGTGKGDFCFGDCGEYPHIAQPASSQPRRVLP